MCEIVKIKAIRTGTRAILFSTGIPASAIYLNNRRILYIFTDRTSCRGYARGGKRGKKNEPLGALTTKWHAKGATFNHRGIRNTDVARQKN